MPTIREKAKEWIDDCRLNDEKPYSARTLEGYLHCLSLLERFGTTRVEGITRDNITRWLYERRRKDRVSAATANRNLAAVLSFVGWLEKRGEFDLEELRGIRRCRLRQAATPPPQFLTHDQFAKLEAVAPSVSDVFALAIDLEVHTGLRVGELLQVDHADFVFDDPEPYLRVARTWGRENKRRQERTVPLGELDGAFVKKLKKLGIGPPRVGPLFPAQHGKASGPYLHKNTLEDWMKTARAAAHLQSWTTFLVLRHTFASWVLKARICDLAVLAKWMGNSIATCHKHYAGWVGGDRKIEKAFNLEKPLDDRPVILRAMEISERTTPRMAFTPIMDDPGTPAANLSEEQSARLESARRAIERAAARGRLP